MFIVTQYFPPEIGASASRWGDYANILLKHNHKVTVMCEAPHYPNENYYPGYKNKWFLFEKKSPSFTIIRTKAFSSDRKSFFKKICHYFVFMFSAIVNSRKIKDFDLLIISTPPLFTGIIGLYLKLFRRRKYWLDLRDLWPESALQLGQIKKGLLYKIGKKIEFKIYKSAEGFILPVPSFKNYLTNLSTHISRKPMYDLMNGVSNKFINTSKSLKISNNKFTVLYSGNMGLAQDLTTIIKAANILKNYNIHFRFIGEGVCRTQLEQLARPLNIKIDFYKSLPRNELVKHILEASVCLVPLKNKKIFNTALPSKMFEYMACGRPVIVSVRGDAEKIINESKAGISISPENPKLLSKAILEYFHNHEKIDQHGTNGFNYITKNLKKEVLISNLMRNIEGSFEKKNL